MTKHPHDSSVMPEAPGRPPHRLRASIQVLGPLCGLIAGGLASTTAGLPTDASITLGVALWTTLWWIFEAVPIPVSSLIPLTFLPLLGVLDSGHVAAAYGNKLVLLLLGGFLLSKAMEKSGAHRRIALAMVNACGGGGGRRLLLGFMLASALLSMWISNTATCLMMLPMAIAIMQNATDTTLRIPLLLGIAYAANVGGIGTPIGTPPNAVMIAAYRDLGHAEIGFAQWMRAGVPVALLMLVFIWLWLGRGLRGKSEIPLPHPGTWRREEILTLTVFLLTAIAWMTRSEPFGGWQSLSPRLANASDASVAMVAVLILFALPNGKGNGARLLDWKTANTIPWGLLILVGGGLCLGTAFKESGLSTSVAGILGGLQSLPLIGLLAIVALVVTFLTELTSNTATTNVLMPILGAAAIAAEIDPILLMLPAAMSASCAFMLPVATMPNAVVFGTGELTVKRMVQEGFILNLIGVAVITSVCYFLFR